MSSTIAKPTTASPYPIVSLHFEDGSTVPSWVKDFTSFRRWTHSDSFPEKGRMDFVAGGIWVDITMEVYFSHNLVKNECIVVLGALIKKEELGYLLTDRMRVANVATNLSAEPDAGFASYDAVAEGRVRLVDRPARPGTIEFEGQLDMVLEIVSDSSVKKDSTVLRQAYWSAGYQEFWLVDVRGETLSFQIMHWTKQGFRTATEQEGWLRSRVFQKEFHLGKGKDRLGRPNYELKVR